MPGDPRQFVGDVRRRQHKIDAAGRDRATRHRIVLSRIVLRERDPTLGLDRLQPQRAVAGRAGQHDADGPLAPVQRQRFKKGIDRPMQSLRPRALCEPQHALPDGEVLVARNNIDMIRLDRLVVCNLMHRQRRGARKDLGQRALMDRIEMLHQHEPHACVLRKMREQLCECLQPSGRCADADYRHDGVCRRLRSQDLGPRAAARFVGLPGRPSRLRRRALPTRAFLSWTLLLSTWHVQSRKTVLALAEAPKTMLSRTGITLLLARGSAAGRGRAYTMLGTIP